MAIPMPISALFHRLCTSMALLLQARDQIDVTFRPRAGAPHRHEPDHEEGHRYLSQTRNAAIPENPIMTPIPSVLSRSSCLLNFSASIIGWPSRVQSNAGRGAKVSSLHRFFRILGEGNIDEAHHRGHSGFTFPRAAEKWSRSLEVLQRATGHGPGLNPAGSQARRFPTPSFTSSGRGDFHRRPSFVVRRSAT